MRALSQAEVVRFRTAAQTNRWRVLFDFPLATGMRPSEGNYTVYSTGIGDIIRLIGSEETR